MAATLCENKDKVGSCCKAKCQLAKEIKKEEKRQSDLPASIKDKSAKSELLSGFISFLPFQTSFPRLMVFVYLNTPLQQYAVSVFHPPTLI